MNVILFNVRSLRRNFNEFILELTAMRCKPWIIVLTEVWIYEHETTAHSIDGYTAYFDCQNYNAAGGVAIYVENSVESHRVRNYSRNVVGIQREF